MQSSWFHSAQGETLICSCQTYCVGLHWQKKMAGHEYVIRTSNIALAVHTMYLENIRELYISYYLFLCNGPSTGLHLPTDSQWSAISFSLLWCSLISTFCGDSRFLWQKRGALLPDQVALSVSLHTHSTGLRTFLLPSFLLSFFFFFTEASLASLHQNGFNIVSSSQLFFQNRWDTFIYYNWSIHVFELLGNLPKLRIERKKK